MADCYLDSCENFLQCRIPIKSKMADCYLESCEYFLQCRIPAQELGLSVRGQNQLHLPSLQPQEGRDLDPDIKEKDTVVRTRVHRKNSFSIFPSPAGMSLTKLSLGGNCEVIYKLFLYFFPRSIQAITFLWTWNLPYRNSYCNSDDKDYKFGSQINHYSMITYATFFVWSFCDSWDFLFPFHTSKVSFGSYVSCYIKILKTVGKTIHGHLSMVSRYKHLFKCLTNPTICDIFKRIRPMGNGDFFHE